MQTRKFGDQVVWFDPLLIDEVHIKRAFDIDYWQAQDQVIGSASGRGTTWFIELDTIQVALRHYRRGGLFGKLVKDSYWYHGEAKTRSRQEFELLKVLKAACVNVPRPVAARVVKSGLTYKADLLSEKIANAQDLVSVLGKQSLSKAVYHKIAVEIEKMHAAQVNHTDLNIHNILIDEDEKVWIIDFDKCHQQNGDDWKQANWQRLKRSFEKEIRKQSIMANQDYQVLFENKGL
ncbi:3-deoxy-D-manno-octulosonic acid kinase [Vibrio sp. WXL103]|uniref:3-deoxy-D-manno-octulosonic acid kinase n=1 Tax=Vibrio sp. WXL103 TaxID=3450710 RepID=UPI003EC77C21